MFADEVGFSLRPHVCRSWAPKGEPIVLRCKGSWKNISGMGIISCTPDGEADHLFVQLFNGTIKEDQVIDFLGEVKKEFKEGSIFKRYKRVILIWDNLAAHRSIKTREYIMSQSDWLIVEYLPAYAPELNPIEYVWSALKRKDIGNCCPDNLDQLEQAVLDGIDRIADDRSVLQGCLQGSPLFAKIPPAPS